MKQKILIVEDDIVFCKLLTRYMEKNGYQTFDAQHAASARHCLGAQDMDLMILDYQLPDQNGIEVMKWVKEHMPNLKVLMLSRNEDEQVVKEAMALGAADYIFKPIQPNELLTKVKEVLVNEGFIET